MLIRKLLFMAKKIKTTLGKIKRAMIGFLLNNLENADLTSETEKIAFGKTAQGREINSYIIGNGRKNVLFMSAIHGNEVGTVKLNKLLLNYLTKEPVYSDYKFYFIPCLNQDGFKKAKQNPDYWNGGNIGRTNSNDVDLNRNFDTESFQSESEWGFGENYSQTKKVFAGNKPLSENETKSLVNFVKTEGIDTIISFHNCGRDITGSNNLKGQKLAKIFSEKSGFKLISEKGWKGFSQTGTLKEWCEKNSIVYLEIEGINRWGSDWGKQKEAIQAVITEI